MVEKDFGRNASHVKASAAKKRVLLYDRRLQSPLSGANRRHIAARPAPDDYQVIFGQTNPPFSIPQFSYLFRFQLALRSLDASTTFIRRAEGYARLRLTPVHKLKILAAVPLRRNLASTLNSRTAYRVNGAEGG
jgi:hypothetical protein